MPFFSALRRAGLVRALVAPLALCAAPLAAQTVQTSSDAGTRLLRQPTLSATQIAFEYGGDIWIVSRTGGEARRLTSTPAVEADPYFSPDGRWIAFTSDRSGVEAVYVVSADGDDPRRLTWSPAGEHARGWTPDGTQVLFASGRASAPTAYAKLFTIPVNGGPAHQLPAYMGFRGAFSPDGKRIVVDRVDRWDVEFRSYRGGQNTPLTITDVSSGAEQRLPNERTMDIEPVWIGTTIYFLSDRDWATNVWSYDVPSGQLHQLTHFTDADVKTLTGRDNTLVFEENGWLWSMPAAGGEPRRLTITVRGDFPWSESHWADVSKTIASASIGPTGKRALFESRGEIFTVPVEKGDARDITNSPAAADRAPVWSPDGGTVAWFSDSGDGYKLLIGDADGMGTPRALPIGGANMAWNPSWSPDGTHIAFVDDKALLRVIDVASGRIVVADTGGAAADRNSMHPHWSPDSRWLAYAKTFSNQFNRIVVWSLADGARHIITDPLASAGEPVWDRNGKWLYFVASTDLGVQSGWADLGSLTHTSTSGVYVALLRNDEATPLAPESDEEASARAAGRPMPPSDSTRRSAPGDTTATRGTVRIDFAGLGRRIVALPMPVRNYTDLIAGPAGTVFVAERVANAPATTLHRWEMATRKSDVFAANVQNVSVSDDGKHLMWRAGQAWQVVASNAPPKPGAAPLRVSLGMQLTPRAEWQQIFDEAWRIERDFFYDPHLHGANWTAVRARYAPLVPYARHRADLNYILDMVGGELSVGHSFVHGGDMPDVDSSRVGALGADLVADGTHWRIARIYTSEDWNPGLRAPLDAPGVKARDGDYLLAVNGVPVTTQEEPWKALDGTANRQTVLRLATRADGQDAWSVTVVPVANELPLRQRAWIEDNRRRVDSLSHGTLAYVWVPNTSAPAITAFDRYYYAQQDRKGAVIDERFNQGGLLDDYMVGIMSRTPVGGVTNFVPGGTATRLPASGIFGPKVLMINEQSGSGGDFFPWVFRQMKVGPEIGTRTWGGLVNASVPYPLVDGGTITAPALAVFGPNRQFVVEGQGVPPDIEVIQDSRDVMQGRDPQLERAVQEALSLVKTKGIEAPLAPAQMPVHARRP